MTKRVDFGQGQIESLLQMTSASHMTISVSDKAKKKKRLGKRRRCWLPAFTPFFKIFSEAFSLKLEVESKWAISVSRRKFKGGLNDVICL